MYHTDTPSTKIYRFGKPYSQLTLHEHIQALAGESYAPRLKNVTRRGKKYKVTLSDGWEIDGRTTYFSTSMKDAGKRLREAIKKQEATEEPKKQEDDAVSVLKQTAYEQLEDLTTFMEAGEPELKRTAYMKLYQIMEQLNELDILTMEDMDDFIDRVEICLDKYSQSIKLFEKGHNELGANMRSQATAYKRVLKNSVLQIAA